VTTEKFSLKIKDHIHTPDGKRTYNEQHFTEAASRYDFAARAMSLGRDAGWKRAMVAALPEMPAPCCIDLACGTGDIAFLLAEKYPKGKVVGIDLTEPMLNLARKRNAGGQVNFLCGDMTATGMPDAGADIITGSYAVRNAPDLRLAFQEIYRLLKPNGVVALLDFSKPTNRYLQYLQCAVLRYWCGFWGLILHGNAEIHAYIAASLEHFPDREQLRALIDESGLRICHFQRFYLGILELLVLRKPARGTGTAPATLDVTEDRELAVRTFSVK
jgi:ubiquinone/menaquinone biosynthesis methyltransferase